MKDRTLTCVYCGKEYPAGTPASGQDVQALTDHIKVCEKHPMRKAERTIQTLRKALVQLVGADDKTELEGMELIVRMGIMPEQDKKNVIDALHALMETQEYRA